MKKQTQKEKNIDTAKEAPKSNEGTKHMIEAVQKMKEDVYNGEFNGSIDDLLSKLQTVCDPCKEQEDDMEIEFVSFCRMLLLLLKSGQIEEAKAELERIIEQSK